MTGLTKGQAQWEGFVLDLQSGELRRRGLRVRLQEVPFRVLALLLEQPGEIVSRDELNRRLWKGYSLGDFDHSLNIAINKLRTALSDSARRPRYIETVPRRGYRFIAPVEKTDGAVRTRLAVLPFANLGGAPEEDYFCDGVTEEMITHLGRLSPEKLGVIARTSSMRLKGAGADEIGRQLGVDYILEGSVRSQESQVRINVQLVQVTDQTQLWSDSFERSRSDVFDVQQEVARRVAASLALELLPEQRDRLARRPPSYTKAAEECLKGRYHLHKRTEDGFKAAIACFESALKEDPRYAAAHAGIAEAYFLWGSHGLRPPIEVYSMAREAAEKALALDPKATQAHGALVFGYCFYAWDFQKADLQYRRAVEQGCFSAELQYYRGIYLTAQGKFDEAVRETRQALRLDPLFPPLNANFCHFLTMARRCQEAIEQGELAVSLDPQFWLSHVRLGRAYLLQGDFEKGIAHHEEAVRLSGGPPTHLALLSYAYGRAGEKRRAAQIFKDMLKKSEERYVCPYFVAEACVPLGDTDRTLEWLERGVKVRASWVSFLGVEPVFDPLRTDPRFDALLSRLGLPRVKLPPQRARGLPASPGGE